MPTFGDLAGPQGWRRLVDLARQAEAAGVDRIVVPDHVVMGPRTDAYSWGRFPVPPDAPWLEPLTVLTAIAAVTGTIRLATGILIAPLRPAALLAKTVATLDVISGGRVDLGVGTGWQREEYLAEGLDFAARGRLLTDTVAACRALWEHTPADFTSPTLSFTEVFCAPRPVQARLPIWFSGVLHERNVSRIVELGDGWIPIMGASPDDIEDGIGRLHDAMAGAGRAPAELRVQAPLSVARDIHGRPDLAAMLDRVPTLLGIGVTDINVNLRAACPELDSCEAVLATLVEGFSSAIG
ncbi:MAG: TIGR03619 family F420-dependent LLM class oxidoreductase [Acidimicrobiales bacterium]